MCAKASTFPTEYPDRLFTNKKSDLEQKVDKMIKFLTQYDRFKCSGSLVRAIDETLVLMEEVKDNALNIVKIFLSVLDHSLFPLFIDVIVSGRLVQRSVALSDAKRQLDQILQLSEPHGQQVYRLRGTSEKLFTQIVIALQVTQILNDRNLCVRVYGIDALPTDPNTGALFINDMCFASNTWVFNGKMLPVPVAEFAPVAFEYARKKRMEQIKCLVNSKIDRISNYIVGLGAQPHPVSQWIGDMFDLHGLIIDHLDWIASLVFEKYGHDHIRSNGFITVLLSGRLVSTRRIPEPEKDANVPDKLARHVHIARLFAEGIEAYGLIPGGRYSSTDDKLVSVGTLRVLGIVFSSGRVVDGFVCLTPCLLPLLGIIHESQLHL